MICAFFLLACLIQSDQDKTLLFHYDFQDVSGNIVSDCSGHNIDATLQNEATIYSMGKYNVLKLENGFGYLDLGAKAGETYSSTDDFTISIYYRVHENSPLDNNGRFLWTFSTLESNLATEGLYTGYRLNAQRFATSTGGYDNEKGMEIGRESIKGRWVHVCYTQTGKTGKFYINGVEKMTNDDMPINTENFKTKPICNWIGRAAFSWDAYLVNTLVYDVRFYGSVLSTKEIRKFANLVDELDNEYMYGSEGDRTEFNKRISEANEILSGDVSKYLKMAVISYQELTTFCEIVNKSEKISQPYLDQLCSQFDEARRLLESSEGVNYEDLKVVDAKYDTNRGFIHPGGFLTDSDFERVRNQISKGNEKVVQAFNILKSSEWSQLTSQTWPVEVIMRGAGKENYINAARGAHIAYQNALRWKLENNDDFARHGVDVLMAWARVCKVVSGNSNWALAAGIYGYEFAQAAEILRTFDGWSKEDFEFFKDWMIRVWALPCYSFLSGRLGTWENSQFIPGVGHGTDGQRPGHYWSNWGLCNVLALQSIGLLCDDVFLYNQALSFYKYDQTTQANWNTENDLFNRGVMEYIDNLVPNVYDDPIEKEAYGKIGQMQESGRDQGHATFSLGLAVDICLTAWNQGDDLFAYHDNRLAAGIEFVAAYNNANVDTLTFINYHYATCRTAWHNAEIHSGPSGISRGQTRPYWGKIIGHYEGVKNVKLPYAKVAYDTMGVDGGCFGGASGAYDHFGFSVLMYTRTEEPEVPTLLSPRMEYKGQTIDHNELGGLTNNFMFMKNKGVPRGDQVKLMPQLPSGEKDTGNWVWNTGETTKEITVTTDKSYVYRVTYTNEKNVKSFQAFMIAADGDCIPSTTTASSYVNDEATDAAETIIAFAGDKVTLRVDGNGEFGSYVLWEDGSEGGEKVFIAKEQDVNISAKYVNHCGASNLHRFSVKVKMYEEHVYVNDEEIHGKLTKLVNLGDNVLIRPKTASNVPKKFAWSDGTTDNFFSIPNIQTTTEVSLKIESPSQALSVNKDYRFVVIANKEYNLPSGSYIIHHLPSGTVLTSGSDEAVFAKPKMQNEKYDRSQIWTVSQEKESKYTICSLDGNKCIDAGGSTSAESPAKFQLWNAVGTDELMVYDEGKEHLWSVGENGKITKKESSELDGYPFRFVRYELPAEPVTMSENGKITTTVLFVESEGGNDDGNSNENKKKSNAGMIAGIVVAVVVVIAIAVVVVIVMMRKKKRDSSDIDLVL